MEAGLEANCWWWTLYARACLAYVGALSWLDLKILEQPSRVVWFLAAACAPRIAIGRFRRGRLAFDFRLAFDERPRP